MKKFFQLFLFLPRFLAILAAYLLRGKKTLTCTLTTEYTFIRYVPVAGAKASATSEIRHDMFPVK